MSDGPMKVLRRKLHLPLPSHNTAPDSIATKMGDAASAFKYEELQSLDAEIAGAVATRGVLAKE